MAELLDTKELTFNQTDFLIHLHSYYYDAREVKKVKTRKVVFILAKTNLLNKRSTVPPGQDPG